MDFSPVTQTSPLYRGFSADYSGITAVISSNLDLRLLSRFALAGPWLWTVSVDLSGYCPGQYPSVHPPLSCRGGQHISAHAYAETLRVIGHFVPPTPAPPPKTVTADTAS